MSKKRQSESVVNSNPQDVIDHFPVKRPVPVALGTGLIALDIVVTDRPGDVPRYWVGGTCGNVLTILSYLGWHTYPLARLGQDVASNWILSDFKRFSVNTRFLHRSENQRTPIVVERIRTKGLGIPSHRFLWTCPNCGAWLPGYQALLMNQAREMCKIIPTPSVFFFDRVSRGALDLARASKELGALVFFEPSGIRDERLFGEALSVSHIVKYSQERLGHLPAIAKYQSPFLEVETLGRDGLRYCKRDGSRAALRWREMRAYPVLGIRDTAGAGDWCTAGLLHVLARKGSAGLRNITNCEIEEALRFGQALAAVKCRYEGARGPMYGLNKKRFKAEVAGVLKGGASVRGKDEVSESALGDLMASICPKCNTKIREEGEIYQHTNQNPK